MSFISGCFSLSLWYSVISLQYIWSMDLLSFDQNILCFLNLKINAFHQFWEILKPTSLSIFFSFLCSLFFLLDPPVRHMLHLVMHFSHLSKRCISIISMHFNHLFLSYHLTLHYLWWIISWCVFFFILKFWAHLSGDRCCSMRTMYPGLELFLLSGFTFSAAALGQNWVLISCLGTPAPCLTRAQGFSFSSQTLNKDKIPLQFPWAIGKNFLSSSPTITTLASFRALYLGLDSRQPPPMSLGSQLQSSSGA